MSGKTVVYGKFNIILPVILFMAGLFFSFGVIYAKADLLPSVDYTLTVNAMDKTYKFYYPEIDIYRGKLYLKNAKEIVDGIYLDTLVRPVDATVCVYSERDYPFQFTKEKSGKGIDKEDLLSKIEKALLKKEKSVTAKERSILAEITVEKLKESTYRRAFFTTNYSYSTNERKHNIALAVKYLGGVQLMPGEEFSFNKRVGDRTEERGFKKAKIIENGKFTDGIGGGVCQVSSTVYNAVLLAGLEVTERHNHSMLVSYVEPSFDAMVSSGYADLKFINNSGSIMFLTATSGSDSLTVSVYGVKSDYTYERVSTVIETVLPPEPEKIPFSGLTAGEQKVYISSKNGAKSKGYIKVIKKGKVIETKLLSNDSYKPLRGVIYEGVENCNAEDKN